MSTKHEQVIDYIRNLAIGQKISVRKLAQLLNFSQGTVYRGIKSAEDLGLVATLDRIGTLRVHSKQSVNSELLTYDEILRITEGRLLAGEAGLEKPVNQFIIGAMELSAIETYYRPHSVLIVGNRPNVQKSALDHAIGVLVTGNFVPDQEIIDLANQREMPLILTSYDTFSVATVINRSIMDQEIRQEILTVDKIYRPKTGLNYLRHDAKVSDFQDRALRTSLSRFPVTQGDKLVGVVTAKDVLGQAGDRQVADFMTRDKLLVTQPSQTVASVSHTMTWQDVEMVPVVDHDQTLLGRLSRQDILKALQVSNYQAQMVHTMEDRVAEFLTQQGESKDEAVFTLTVQPQMVNASGSIAYGILSQLVAHVAMETIPRETYYNHMIEKLFLQYFSLLQLGNHVTLKGRLFHQSKGQALVEVDVYHDLVLCAKALVTCRLLEDIS